MFSVDWFVGIFILCGVRDLYLLLFVFDFVVIVFFGFCYGEWLGEGVGFVVEGLVFCFGKESGGCFYFEFLGMRGMGFGGF